MNKTIPMILSLAMFEDLGDLFIVEDSCESVDIPKLVCPVAYDGSHCLNYALASGCSVRAKNFPQCTDCTIPKDEFKNLL